MKKQHIVLGCAAVFLLAACGEVAHLVEFDRTAEAPYERGKTYFADAKYGRAVEQFQLVLSVEPGSVAALNGLGASYDQLGRFDLAERYYKRALSVAPESTQTLNNLGVSYLLQGRPDLAAVYLAEARRLDDEDPSIAANHAAAAAMVEVGSVAPLADEAAPVVEKPIRRQTAAVQRLFTKLPAGHTVPVPLTKPASERALAAASGLSIELSMAEPAAPMPAVKGDESPKPYSSLTIEIGESVEAS